MKIAHLKLSLITALAALPELLSAAPIPLTGTIVHSENFDSFGTSTRAWANDSTLAGWFAQISTLATATGNLQPTDGTAVLTALLNCGSSGSTDRAFGSKPTGAATSNIAYAVSFRNAGANPILFSKLNYTGELWRTNTGSGGPPLVPVDEIYTVFYQVSTSAVTDILAGPNSTTAAPGAGFTALGAGANWINPVNTPLATATTGALDGNDPANRTAVSFSPASSIVIQPGQFLMIKWTDPNVAGTDGFQAIDDVSVEFTELIGSVSASVSARTRNLAGTPFNAADDTFGFTAAITGTGVLGPNWIASDVSDSPANAGSGPYGTPVAWTGFPIGATKTVLISDVSTPALNTTVFVDPPPLIGSNNLVVADAPILQEDNVIVVGWTIDNSARTLTQNDQAAQGDKVINSQVIDLSTAGFVQFTAELDAIAGSTGFEAADSFALRLIIDGGAAISVLGTADADSSGRLTGLDDTLGVGPELPGNDDAGMTKPFSFRYLIPDTANSVQIRIIGNSNSPGETFLVKNIKLGPPPPTIYATLAGPSILDNKGTADPADDEFSGGLNIVDVNITGSTIWDSDSPPLTGLYSTAVDTFGPFPVSGGAKLVRLFDRADTAVTTSITIPLPPAAAVTASAPANIIRIENGQGTADDSMAFDVTLTGVNGGPGWTATGASPAGGAYGPVTFTIPAPLPASPATVTVADVSYPTATLVISVPVPGRYIIGQKNLGAGLLDVESDLNIFPASEWVNDAGARTFTMTAGGTGDKVVASEVLNLSGAGIVYFSANLNARETSNGSNFESNDRFKAELIIDGGTATEQIINLVTSYDRGNGDPAIGGGGGPNGPPDGYINGYQGIALAPANAEDDYNANRIRDEFNLLNEVADNSLNNNFSLSYTIPAPANSVQLKIYGAGPATSETFLVSGVLFSTTAPVPDSDGDGVSNADELVMGTDPDIASDVLRLSPNAANPGQLDFPTKAGRFYRVYVSNDVDGQEGTHLSIWKDAVPLGLAAGTIAGDGNPASFTISIAPGEPRRFYRLHVMQTDGPNNDGVWPATVP